MIYTEEDLLYLAKWRAKQKAINDKRPKKARVIKEKPIKIKVFKEKPIKEKVFKDSKIEKLLIKQLLIKQKPLKEKHTKEKVFKEKPIKEKIVKQKPVRVKTRLPRAKYPKEYSKKFIQYLSRCRKRNITIDLSQEEFNNIIFKDCHYCGISNSNGIDRINSKMGYIEGNMVPCCGTCNLMKKSHSVKEFFMHIRKLYTFNNLSLIDL